MVDRSKEEWQEWLDQGETRDFLVVLKEVFQDEVWGLRKATKDDIGFRQGRASGIEKLIGIMEEELGTDASDK